MGSNSRWSSSSIFNSWSIDDDDNLRAKNKVGVEQNEEEDICLMIATTISFSFASSSSSFWLLFFISSSSSSSLFELIVGVGRW